MDEASELRGKICGVMRKAKVPKDNLSSGQRCALNELGKMSDIAILPADKGNTTVVMNKAAYHGKISEMLDSGTYGKLKKDPTQSFETKITKALKNLERIYELPTQLYRRLKPTGSKPPLFYGLPKIHKVDIPLRPIVASIGSPSYSLSKYIASMISPLAGKTDSFIKDSAHFVDLVKDIKLSEDEIMISFDVKSLFTNVPITEAVEVIHGMLKSDDTLEERTVLSPDRIAELLDLCLRSTYFSYNDAFYEQKEGAAMGSPVSAVVGVRESIQFTFEMEKNGSLPFLDCEVTRGENGNLSTKVFRKKTHTDRYLNFNSHHPTHVKRGVVKCLFNRAEKLISDKEEIEHEQQHLRWWYTPAIMIFMTFFLVKYLAKEAGTEAK